MNLISKKELAETRALYTAGTIVELIKMVDPYTKLKKGDRGEVQFVDDSGTIHCRWQNGEGLGLIIGVDKFRIIQ